MGGLRGKAPYADTKDGWSREKTKNKTGLLADEGI